ncbi:WD40 repeat-like protein [Annulohypoxylon truncatum]|uniref:WD40 repeat-like protein n=1 Tax=Annulohypoxylon truncatum TaxID=327061 RepID=UPI0020075602|nr:WD40 repeat-like protein [Annulohypoxylon truncatum]KAI1204794.1 WD40 repeat-like protein [Annulohypoxylon truncatum]
MYPLTCVDGYKIPVREEVYVLDIIPFASGPGTISSDQKLSLFNPTNLSVGPLVNLVTQHGNITCAKAFDVGNNIVCTAGENGSVSMWDLRKDARQAEVAKLTDNQVPVLSLACSSAGFTVVAGTELQDHQASILVWDIRSTPTPKLHYKEVHSDDVTELNFHPSDYNILLSGSTDGLVNICDTRITDEDEVVIQTFNHDASIHHAAFLNDTEVFALSHDEKLALYDVAESHENGAATTNFGDMREVLGCQYVANVSAKSNGAGAVIGAGTHDRETFDMIHLTKGQGWQLDRESIVSLPGAHSSEIVRSFCFYDEAQMVFSAGEDGYIKAWKPNA